MRRCNAAVLWILVLTIAPGLSEAQDTAAAQSSSEAQTPSPREAALQAASAPEANGGPPTAVERFEDPFEAFQSGSYDQALQGFLDDQIEYPEDPVAALNVGSAHYEMRNYSEADKAFSTAALSTDSSVRQKALYNLGNTAYREGRLQEAVELYKSALDLDPDDVDAKFNLEFVRDEIRRRHEEAQKRQDQQQQQQQSQEQQQEQQQQQDASQPQDQNRQQDDADRQEPDSQDSESSEASQDAGRDSDSDGLSDETETSADNPTDPQNPDSDGDGLPDGAEDLNRNGRVDPQETDPNRADTDGDGVPDSQEAMAGSAASQQAAESTAELTPEEAERYLQALEEGRPVRRQPDTGRRRPTDKDW